MFARHLTPIVPLCCLVLLLAGCTGARTTSASIDDLAGVDLIGMDDQAYQAACKRICASTGQACSGKTARSEGPKAVLKRQVGVLVLSGEAESWSAVAVDGNGRRQWQQDLSFATPVAAGSWSVIQVQDIPNDVLTCRLAGDGGLGSVSWALTDERLLVIRAVDKAGRVATARIAAEQPGLSLGGGSIESGDPVAILAALVELSQPAAQADRHRPSVRATAEALASGTNRWVAEAAAQLLIQP